MAVNNLNLFEKEKTHSKISNKKRLLISLCWLAASSSAAVILGLAGFGLIMASIGSGGMTSFEYSLIVLSVLYTAALFLLGVLVLFQKPEWLYKKKSRFLVSAILVAILGVVLAVMLVVQAQKFADWKPAETSQANAPSSEI